MSKHHEKAKKIFAAHSKKDTLHFTDDGQAFFEENPAKNHAKTLDVKGVVKIERHELSEISTEVDNDDDEEGLKNLPVKKKADESSPKKKVEEDKADKKEGKGDEGE